MYERLDREDKPVALAGLLGFLGQAATVVSAGQAIARIVNPEYNQPAAEAWVSPTAGVRTPLPGMSTSITPYTAALPALGPGATTAVAWLKRVALRYGPIIAQAVWNLYQDLRTQGLEERQARDEALRRHGIARGRRRMNPANIRALRRAVRRVRSFQKTVRKVRGVLPTRGGGGHTVRHYVRHRRRGDVSPFAAEDMADYYDTVEDLGYEPDSFRDDEEGE